MRHLRAIPLALAVFCVAGPTLTQAPDGTWTTSAHLDTAALCDDTRASP